MIQREWFDARARGYKTTLDAALFGNAIPTAVVENLIRETKRGRGTVPPLSRLRKRALGLEDYHVFDAFDADRRARSSAIAYDDVCDWIVESVAPLGADYQARLRRGIQRPLD